MAGRVPARLTPAEGRRFGLTVGAAFGVLCALTTWRGHQIPSFVFGALAAGLLLAGLLLPGRLSGVHDAWMRMAHAISRVTTPIFMGIVYFLVLTPTGILRRIFGRNSLVHVERDGSYLVERTAEGGRRSDLTRQF